MKAFLFIFLSLFLFLQAGFGQDYQVSATGIYSLDPPMLDYYDGNVYLVYGTNYKFYKYPVAGPDSGISDPVNPSPESWGPYYPDIAVNPVNGDIASIFIDWKSDEPAYINFLVKSSDGGTNWTSRATLDTVLKGSSMNTRTDLPAIGYSASGNLYYLYYVDIKAQDTAAIYLQQDGGGKFKVDEANASKTKYAVSWLVTENGTSDEVYIVYGTRDGEAKFFLKKYTFTGSEASSWEKELTSLGSVFFDYNSFSKILKDANGRLYFAYNYYGSNGTYLIKSEDDGDNWSTAHKIDNHRDLYVELLITPDNRLVMFRNIDANVSVCSSRDGGDTWTDTVHVNSAPGHAIGDFAVPTFLDAKIVDNEYAVIAWVDDRMGNEEIFGAYAEIPKPATSLEEQAILPNSPVLLRNYPNPFNPSTEIAFSLPSAAHVTIDIYDAAGQFVRRLTEARMNAGKHKVRFEAADLSSGIYFAVLKTGTVSRSLKMMLIR